MRTRRRRDSSEDSWGLRPLSIIRGRERWEVKALKRNPSLAQNLEQALLRRRGILHASANPVSGRVLVFYSPETLGLNVEALIRDSLKELSWGNGPWLPTASSTTPLSRIIKASLPERKYLVAPPLLSLAGNILAILQGQAFLTLFNTARGEGPRFLQAIGLTKTNSRLLFMTGWSLFLTGANILVQPYRKRAWRWLAQTSQHKIRTELIARIESQDMSFFNSYGTGRIINLVTKDTEQIADLVERAGDELIEKVLTIIVSGIFLLIVSPSLALLAGVSLPFVLLVSRVYGRRISGSYAHMGEAESTFSQMLENNLAGIVDVKSFTNEQQETFRLSSCDAQRAAFSLDAASVSTFQGQLTGGIFSLGFALSASYGGKLAAAGKISEGQYFRAAFLFPQLLGALTSLEQIGQLYHGASSSAERLSKVLEDYPKIQDGPVRLPASKVRGEIIFDNVSFGYTPAVQVLKNVSFQLTPGETLAIVGPTGSGKSTLLSLLLRFYDVDEGRILLDGVDIRQMNLHDLRAAVSLVSQDVHLFEGTVRENVLYGQPNASEARVIEAMRNAGALNLLEALPGGLNASVGQRGQRLSGGERQRVAIARALIKIFSGASMLALDEATSHLDSETESLVKQSLRIAAAEKSVVIIAHRLSTIRSADKILVLERGKVTEEGSHDELLARKGLYASLWQIQNEDPFGGNLELRISH